VVFSQPQVLLGLLRERERVRLWQEPWSLQGRRL
jgi:hypothetical protein